MDTMEPEDGPDEMEGVKLILLAARAKRLSTDFAIPSSEEKVRIGSEGCRRSHILTKPSSPTLEKQWASKGSAVKQEIFRPFMTAAAVVFEPDGIRKS